MRRVRNGSFTSNIERVETKEELLESLEKYKGILSVPMIEYLNSLIELEFSVVRENIGNKIVMHCQNWIFIGMLQFTTFIIVPKTY